MDMNETTNHTPEKPEAETEKQSQVEGKQTSEEQTSAEASSDAANPEAPAQKTTPEKDPLEAAQAEIAELKDKLLRAVAETENLRRRAERERQDAANFAITNFARDLLSGGDNLRRALESLPGGAEKDETLKTLLDGVEMTERELLNSFEKHGIRKIDPKGEKFDHNYHQAMFEVPNSGEPDGTVVQVMQVGYVLKDRLLRPALVGVAKGGDKAQPSQEHVDTTA